MSTGRHGHQATSRRRQSAFIVRFASPGPDSAIVRVAAPSSRLLRIAPVSEEQIMNYVAERLRRTDTSGWR
jgi:hypothetical protein